MHQQIHTIDRRHPAPPPRITPPAPGLIRQSDTDPAFDAQQRRQYDDIMSRLRAIAVNPTKLLPPNDYLTALHRAALTLTKRTYQQFKQAPSSFAQTPAIIAPGRLLGAAQQLLDRHDRQLRILVEHKETALELCGLIAEMPRERPPKLKHLEDLAERLIGQNQRHTSLDEVLTQPGLPVSDVLGSVLPTHHPHVYFGGVSTARLLIAMADAKFRQSDCMRHLVIAALLQDVGCLALPANLPANPLNGTLEQRRMYRRHPQLSAAMIGRIRHHPVNVVRLVARHHERIDGSGFPRGLSGLQINEMLRMLTAAVQYVELNRTPIAAERFVTHPHRRCRELGLELAALADGGKLDARWTRWIVDRLAPADAARNEHEGGRQIANGRNHTLHGTHTPFRQPHRGRSDIASAAPTDHRNP